MKFHQKILVIGSTYPRSVDDHQVPWLRQTVNRLAARGHHVTVLASSYRGLGRHIIDGITVHRYRYAPAVLETLTHDEGAPNKRRNPLTNLLAAVYVLSGTFSAVRLAWRLRADVIHVHWPFPHGIMGLVAGWITGAQVVGNCHGAELAMARNSAVIARILRWTLRQCDGVLCNSSHTRAQIKQLADLEAEIMPYGSTVAFPPLEETGLSLPTTQRPRHLLFCGRLIERKGVDVLLAALPIIHRSYSVRLTITGEGDCKAAWQALARQLGIADLVRFTGFVSTEELAELYRNCDIYVHPAVHDSRGDTEGLGVVLIEALMHAKPVVASAVGGIPDVIRHDSTGVLVPERNPLLLAQAIVQLLDNPGQAALLGRQGRQYAEWLFSWDRIIGELERYYRRLHASAATGRLAIDLSNRETSPHV